MPLVLQRRNYLFAEQFQGAHGVLVGQLAALGLQQQRAYAQPPHDIAQNHKQVTVLVMPLMGRTLWRKISVRSSGVAASNSRTMS